MHPILVSSAASAAGEIIQNIAERFTSRAQKAAPTAQPAVTFSTLIDKASVPTAVQHAHRVRDLSTKLGRSVELAAAANEAGATVPIQVQIDADGTAALRLPGGGWKPIVMAEEMRAVVRELYQLQQPITTAANVGRPGGSVTLTVG
jgi:hypothetical protein